MFSAGDMAAFFALGPSGLGAVQAEYRTAAGGVYPCAVLIDAPTVPADGAGVRAELPSLVARVLVSAISPAFARGDVLEIKQGGHAGTYRVNGRPLDASGDVATLPLGAPA